MGVGHFGQLGDDLVQRRQHGLLAGTLAHQGMRQVVDVLGSTGEVDELADLDHFRIALGLVLDPVFQRLDVVIGGGFDGFHLGRLLRPEVGDQRIQLGDGGRREGGDLGKVRLGGQGLQPFDLHLQTGADQAKFGKVLAQGVNLAGVTAVERRKGSQGIESHGSVLFGKRAILPSRRSAAHTL